MSSYMVPSSAGDYSALHNNLTAGTIGIKLCAMIGRRGANCADLTARTPRDNQTDTSADLAINERR
jgi:hypothetical protein